MARLQIAREVLTKARERSNLNEDEQTRVDGILGRNNGKGAVNADVGEFPLAFLKALLDDSRLTPNQRAVVCVQVYGMSGRRIDPDEVTDAADTMVRLTVSHLALPRWDRTATARKISEVAVRFLSLES